MSKPENQTCADEAYLERYLLEQLDEKEESSVQAHLGGCAACQDALERVAGDPSVWAGVREHGASSLGEESGDVDERRIERLLEYLGPTDDPAMLGRLDQYEICGVIGQGATGIVLKALEPALHRFVAIKVLSPMFSSSGAARKRFERESRAVAAVSHEHVVPIYAVSEFNDLPYLVMQYVPGLSLLQRIEKEGALETCEVARIGLQVARGLAAAHAQGIVHRDVKPANVLLEDTVDRAMVTDFGLARVADEATMTRSGTLAGTPQYMSPEQAKGASVDPRSDLFSLGSLMYAAATAKAPFAAETVYGVINRVCSQAPRPIREINPRIDAWLVQFIDRLMAKEPADRFESARVVADLLEAELAYLQHPTGVPAPTREWARSAPVAAGAHDGRRRVPWGWIGVAVLGLAVTAWALYAPDGDGGDGTSSALFGVPGKRDADAPAPLADERPIVVPALVGLEGASVGWTRKEDEWSKDAAVAFDQRIDHRWALAGATKVIVEADVADVVVRSVASSTVTLSVMRRVVTDTQEHADQTLAAHGIGVIRDGDAIRIHCCFQRRERTAEDDPVALRVAKDGSVAVNGSPLSSRGRAAQRRIKRVLVKIGVPGGVGHEVRTVLGDVSVGTVHGPMAIRADRGDVDIAHIEGDLRIRMGRGELGIRDGIAGNVALELAKGEAALTKVGGDVRVDSKGGCVSLTAVAGTVDVDAVGGTVSLRGCAGGVDVMANAARVIASDLTASARLRVSGGWLRLGENPGRVRAHVTGSDVRIDDLAGPLKTHCASGTVTLNLSKSPAADARISTRDGRVRVNYSPAVDAFVTTTSKATGDIAWTEAAAQTGAGDDRVRHAALGEGGKTLALGTTTGDIVFRRMREPGPGKGLGGSGLGGSGPRGALAKRSARAIAKTSGPPRPGALATVRLEGEAVMDGYTLYLPVSHETHDGRYGVLVYLQGGYGVGGDVSAINEWGLPRLIRDEHDLTSERNRLLLDSFIVVSPHIQKGDYFDHPDVIRTILDDVFRRYKADPSRVYLSGLSRGGHGCWGLAAKMPNTFAAINPIGGRPHPIRDHGAFKDLPVWVVHNQGDTTVDFAPTNEAVARIEQASAVTFLRIEDPVPSGDEYLTRRHLFTQPLIEGHDAWTDLYTSVAFYRWLLKQRRPRKV